LECGLLSLHDSEEMKSRGETSEDRVPEWDLERTCLSTDMVEWHLLETSRVLFAQRSLTPPNFIVDRTVFGNTITPFHEKPGLHTRVS
jgi:hypothetical protein